METAEYLVYASSKGDVEKIQKILDREDQNIIHSLDDEPLHQAVQNGCFNAVEFLLDNGADVHSTSNLAIRKACKNGDFDMLKLLEEKGAIIENDCLHQACRYGHLEIVQYLINKGCDIESRDHSEL